MPTNRRKFLLQSGMAATALLTARSSKAVSKANSWLSDREEKDNTILLLHTNDINNQLFAEDGLSTHRGLGGFYRTRKYISELISTNTKVVLIDAGNSFSGYSVKKDLHNKTLEVMGQLRYDATMPGPRDLKAGVEHYRTALEKNKISVITTNYNVNGELKTVALPYKVIKKGHLKIGIVSAGQKLNSANLEYKDAITEISSAATMLKKEKGCNLVVCLSQLGFKNKTSVDDITLAKNSENVDVIIGGNSRKFMRQPSLVLNKAKQEVIINHAGRSGIVVGSIQITFNNKGEKQGVKFKNYLVGAERWRKEFCS